MYLASLFTIITSVHRFHCSVKLNLFPISITAKITTIVILQLYCIMLLMLRYIAKDIAFHHYYCHLILLLLPMASTNTMNLLTGALLAVLIFLRVM